MSENVYNRCPNCARLERKIAVLQKKVAQLEQLLIEATRANKRQAAPFSKAKPKNNPQKPGRKASQNYGTKAHRQAPDPWQELDQIIDVPLPEQCPDCGGTVEQKGLVQQFQVEIPRRYKFSVHHAAYKDLCYMFALCLCAFCRPMSGCSPRDILGLG